MESQEERIARIEAESKERLKEAIKEARSSGYAVMHMSTAVAMWCGIFGALMIGAVRAGGLDVHLMIFAGAVCFYATRPEVAIRYMGETQARVVQVGCIAVIAWWIWSTTDWW